MNKLVLVTGATSGFGNGLVKKLLERGCRVIATGRNLSHRPDIFSEERSRFSHALQELDLDVTISAERIKAVEFAEKMGGIDVLINNAGYGLFGPLEDASDSKMRDQFEVNFFGPAQLIRDFLPQLRKQSGTIINLSSVLGFVGFPMASLYCASKFAIEGLSESLAYELAPHGVKVVLIQPGGYKTSFSGKTQWTFSGDNPSLHYSQQISGYRRMRDRQNQSLFYQNPDDVTEGILNLLANKNFKMRNTFGQDAQVSRFFRALLPREWFHLIATKIYSYVFIHKNK
ncbi:MAG: hypothetical protein RJB66_2114 [Pseudomonadota bacterium]|jgi:short-subunit dehydrogenase